MKLLLSKNLIIGVEYDFILIIIEQLIKYLITILYLELSIAKELAFTFLKEIVLKYKILEEIISNQDKLFISKFQTSLTALLGVKRKLSTAFYLQINGGIERINQIIELYLRYYVNYKQDDQVSLLPLAEYAYNSSATNIIKVLLFFTNYRYNLSAYYKASKLENDN